MWLSPRFGALTACFPPRNLKKPRPKEERAFLVPKLSSAFTLEGSDAIVPDLFLAFKQITLDLPDGVKL